VTYNEKVLSRAEGAVTVELSIAQDSGYFDGHFPALRILPAVAQSDIAIRLGARYAGTPLTIVMAKKLKFAKVIRPEMPVQVSLSWPADKTTLSFKMTDPASGALFSSGSFVMRASS
jgi:3-hydroxymyristoyl/3-hydroxydecanoyl-(acyl carrier protein) dehydratase